MEFLLTLLYFLAFCFIIRRFAFFKLDGISKKWSLFVFSLKFICGLLLWAIYTYYYTDRSSADIYKYFDDAMIIQHAIGSRFDLAFQILTGIVWQKKEVMDVLVNTNHWFRSFDYIQINDNRIIIRLNLLLLYFSRGIFHVHTLFFTFFSFVGAVALYRFFSQFETRKAVLFICSFLIPSVIFWTSGVLKESWLFFLMGLFLWQYEKVISKVSFPGILVLLLLSFGLLFIKPFILILLFPALCYLLLRKVLPLRKEIFSFSLVHTGILILLLIYLLMDNDGSIFMLMQAQQDAFYAVAAQIGDVSTISLPNVSDIGKAVSAAPQAVFNSLFRPFIWEGHNILQLFAALENILFVVLILLILVYYKKPADKTLELSLFCLSFVILLALLIGWTTPVLGTIVRYKVPLLPFFAILLFQFIDLKKLENTFQK